MFVFYDICLAYDQMKNSSLNKIRLIQFYFKLFIKNNEVNNTVQ